MDVYGIDPRQPMVLKSAQINGAEIVNAFEGLFALGVNGTTRVALGWRLYRLSIAGDIKISKAVF